MDTQVTAKNPDAGALGRLGGAIGGHDRASKPSAAHPFEIARYAALTRWKRVGTGADSAEDRRAAFLEGIKKLPHVWSR